VWRSSGKTHQDLINNLVRNKLINHENGISAMKSCDRKFFILPKYQDSAYDDNPLSIACNVTISAPHMYAMMID
jgi:protein-L-isoaspartate(D-aspartate) O-methyltransferase